MNNNKNVADEMQSLAMVQRLSMSRVRILDPPDRITIPG